MRMAPVERKIHLHLMLSEEEDMAVRAMADGEGISVSDYVRRLIRQDAKHMINQTKKKR